jgi:uncharacterized protein (TIGR02266 family)
MSQDTRKDPRAKVLTMTVRYKSATLDEFIEHHSYDVSRGGMFIKTPSPFPPGTLLKFEVKIAADQKVIQGVGRVVWKRDSETHGDARPAGMGVKFIKIDDASRKVIDTLVESRGDAGSAYEAGGGDSGHVPAQAPAPASMPSKAPGIAAEAPRMPSARKQTMIGLGAMNPSNRPPVVAPVADKPTPSFFPDTKSEAEMPAPEDRTVMKQARELLQDALAQTGSSMEEVAAAPKYADPPAAPTSAGKLPVPEAPSKAPASLPAEPKAVSARPAASAVPASAAPKAAVRKSAVSAAPASRRVSVPAAAPVENSGGGRVILIVVAIAAAAGIAFALSNSSSPAPAPAPSASAEPAPAASLAPPVASEAPVDTASAAPAESAAPPPPEATVAPSAAPALAAPKPAAAKPAAAVPKPAPVLPAKPVLQQRPAPKPAVKPPSEPAEPSAPSEPTAEKPAAPAAPTTPTAAAPTPAPTPVAPKPKPVEPAGDNPY